MCEKGIFEPFLHTGTLGLQNIKKEKLYIDNKFLIKQLEIFCQPMHIYFETCNCWPLGVKIAAWHQR